jgi:murein DD-endopeptidase MepM/ murein hydrolase activator NlpD
MPRGTKLYAIGDGTIVDCNDGVKDQPPGVPAGSGAPSNWIILKFTAPDGKYKGKTLYSYFQHLTKGGVLVKKGQKVKKGDLIGKSGNSGNTTGDHLHLTVLKPGYTMNRDTRYAYLNNPDMVAWEPKVAWGGGDTKYGIWYEVYVKKLKPGVEDSKSVRKLRECLIKREFMEGDPEKPGNNYTDKVKNAVARWQTKKGYEPDGVMGNKQAKKFFENNTHTKVIPE